jgi:hypothetical protein
MSEGEDNELFEEIDFEPLQEEVAVVEPRQSEVAPLDPRDLDDVRMDLFEALSELGMAVEEAGGSGSPGAGCHLSLVPTDRHGHGGIEVSWLPAGGTHVESADVLHEALGPLLLALGFSVEPYSAEGHWIVTGSRRRAFGAPGG